MIERIQKIFKVESLSRLIVIFTVFGITGSLSVYFGKYVLLFFFSENLEKNFIYWSIRIFCLFFNFPLITMFDHAVKKHSGIQAASLKEIFLGI